MKATLSKLAILIPTLCAMAVEGARAGTLTVSKSPSSSVDIGRYEVFELTLTHTDPGYTNPFWGIDIDALFISPGGVEFEVGGFYYDANTWKLRFSPNVEGTWTYALVMRLVGTHDKYITTGDFDCIPSSLHGRPRVHPDVPTRLVAADGTPFNALGTNIFAYQHPFLHPTAISGSTFKDKWDEYFDAYASHGCNTFRRLLGTEAAPFGSDTVSHLLLWSKDTGTDKYDIARCKTFDDMCDSALSKDIRLICVFYDAHDDFEENPLYTFGVVGSLSALYDLDDAEETALHEKYMTYIVNRYGTYVHTWQLFNEYTGDGSTALDLPWQEHMAAHVRAADPYGSFVCNSSIATAPTASYQDIRAPHMYVSDPDDKLEELCPPPLSPCGPPPECDDDSIARKIDEAIRQEAAIHSDDGLPSNFDEFGAGQGGMPNDYPDAWRVAIWAAYFCDSGITFWDDDADHDVCDTFSGPGSQNANAYIDDGTRDLFLIRDAFTDRFSQALTRNTPTTNDSSNLRAFGLANTTQGLFAAYVHSYQTHDAQTSGKTITIQVPIGSYVYEWVDPATGSSVSGLQYTTVSNGNSKTLNIPSFTQDIALALWKDADVTIVTTGLPVAAYGSEYNEFVEASGGGMPYTWSISSGSLPAGMHLDAESGQISGAPKFTAIYIFTVRVVAADSSVDTQQLSISATGGP